MKSKNEFILNKNRLLELSLLKSQKININTKLTNFEELKFIKSALKTIYKYHMTCKKILFIGMPLSLSSRAKIDQTNHIYLPSSIWLEGVLLNKLNIIKYLKKKKDLNINDTELFLQLIQKPDLVVILNKKFDEAALNECFLSKIPIISVNSKYTDNDLKSTYKIPTNINLSEPNYDVFSSFIISIIKRKPFSYKNRLKALFYVFKKKRKFLFKRKQNRRWFTKTKKHQEFLFKRKQNRRWPTKTKKRQKF